MKKIRSPHGLSAPLPRIPPPKPTNTAAATKELAGAAVPQNIGSKKPIKEHPSFIPHHSSTPAALPPVLSRSSNDSLQALRLPRSPVPHGKHRVREEWRTIEGCSRSILYVCSGSNFVPDPHS
jgi:hypothetical protein